MSKNSKIYNLLKKITKKNMKKKDKIFDLIDSLEVLKLINLLQKNKMKFNFKNYNKDTTLGEFIEQLNKDN